MCCSRSSAKTSSAVSLSSASADGVASLQNDLLERDLAMQVLVKGFEQVGQASRPVRPQHAESLAAGRGRADGVIDGAVGNDMTVVLGQFAARSDVGK